MRYSEITEKSLPLLKGSLPHVRGSYGAFIITMSPQDFLKLTASPFDYERIANTPFPEPRDEFITSYDAAEKDFGRFSPPFLNVSHPSGKVHGHEGRHRAMMIMRQGGYSFPVVIYLRTDYIYVVTYEEWNSQTDVETPKREVFSTSQDAKARMAELKSHNSDLDSPIRYFTIQSSNEGGAQIKGSPAFVDPTDPWKKRAFVKSDMPAQLISEYSDDVIVTDYRVGVVKGYKHFRA